MLLRPSITPRARSDLLRTPNTTIPSLSEADYCKKLPKAYNACGPKEMRAPDARVQNAPNILSEYSPWLSREYVSCPCFLRSVFFHAFVLLSWS